MSDLIGRLLGHYRIVEQIGAGGMGVVYRARDERLDRDVAIKVLPEEVARDADRLSRFEREAKAVARLDHPNILAIHDFGTDQGVTYSVTELLEGQNLRRGIPTNGMDWRRVVEVGAAIADGLAAAHAKGIVHRDLKPENVIITADGRVKVLDFGLAQVRVAVDAEAETETMTPAGTVPGSVMGTMGYMSPEQLRGESSDARSDIFALGCVLYEMLSGKTAFLRASTAETTAAILKEDPPGLADSGTTAPSELERAVRRCLEKSPEARFQSAADLAFSLRSIGTGDAVRVVAAPTNDASVDAGSSSSGLTRNALVAIALIVVLAASWWVLNRWGSDDSAPAFQSMTITPVTSLGTVRSVAISPDGRQLAYLRSVPGSYSIGVRQVATGSEVEVVPSQDLSIVSVAFSPDGEHVIFQSRDNSDVSGLFSIFRVPTLGGEVRRLVVDADGLPTYSPDGGRIAFRRGIPGKGVALVVADADGSGQWELFVADDLVPAWSADGRTIAAMVESDGVWRVFLFDVDTGSRRAIVADFVLSRFPSIEWLPNRQGLLVEGTLLGESDRSQIWRISIDDDGSLDRITNDPNDYSGISLSADGTVLATVLQQWVGHLFVAPVDDPESIRQLTHGSRERVGRLDADGDLVVFERMPDGNMWGLWSCNSNGDDLRPLDTDGLQILLGKSGVSAVGGRVLFSARAPGQITQIWSIDDLQKPPQQVTSTESGAFAPSLAPDGSWFVYTKDGPNPVFGGIWQQSTAGGDPKLLSVDGAWPSISPSGEHIAATGWRINNDGNYTDYLEVLPVAGGAPKLIADGYSVYESRWQPDGQAITFLIDGQVWRQPLDGGLPKQLTHFDRGRAGSHAWSPDGKWLYVVIQDVTRDAVLIRDFQ